MIPRSFKFEIVQEQTEYSSDEEELGTGITPGNPKEEVTETIPGKQESVEQVVEESEWGRHLSEDNFFRASPVEVDPEFSAMLSSITSDQLKKEEKTLARAKTIKPQTVELFKTLKTENLKKLKIAALVELADLINKDLGETLIYHGSTKLGYKFSAILNGKYSAVSTHRTHKAKAKFSGSALDKGFIKDTLNLFERACLTYSPEGENLKF